MRLLHRIGLVVLVGALAAAAPVSLGAQSRFEQPNRRVAHDEGYRRGVAAGERDGRDRHPFNFSIVVDFRNGDAGYRREYGDRDRYRSDFRIGFEAGYREGFARFGVVDRSGPPYGLARGHRGGGSDLAWDNGYRDGYAEGLNDGRSRHRNSPGDESRYRNGDRGYERWYGSKDAYRATYRDGFWEGYEQGYTNGWRYR